MKCEFCQNEILYREKAYIIERKNDTGQRWICCEPCRKRHIPEELIETRFEVLE